MLAVGLMPEFDCSTCTAKQKIARGCEADTSTPIDLAGEQLTRCPRRPLLENPAFFSKLFWGHQQFKKGLLPEEGSLASQPAKLMDMFYQIDLAHNMIEHEQVKQRKKDEARRARSKKRRGK